MGRFIVNLNGYYLEWSTITDSPVTFGMTLDEFREYYLGEYGRSGYRDLDARLKRVKESGTSAFDRNLVSLISGNHAGPDEAELTLDEIYRAYCLQEPILGGWLVPVIEEEESEVRC